MAIGKGFVLHTDFTTHPSQFPAIGTIIQDPDRPVTGPRLSELPSEPDTHIHQDSYQATRSSSSAVHVTAWVKFCEQFNINASTGVSHERAESFYTAQLDTKRYLRYPDLTAVLPRTQEHAVKNRMNTRGVRRSKAVFIVTGLKIARGFRHVRLGVDKKHIEAGGTAMLAEQATAGGQVEASKGTMEHGDVRSLEGGQNDIVYAYELGTISYSGWRAAKVQVSLREPTGAFSSSSGQPVEDDVAIESTSFEDLDEAAADNEVDVLKSDAVEALKFDEQETEDQIFCASYPERV